MSNPTEEIIIEGENPENTENQENPVTQEEQEEPEEEIDPELRRLIFERSLNKSFFDDYERPIKTSSPKPKGQKKLKNTLSLEQFNNKITEQLEQNVEKKFVSKRAEIKRKDTEPCDEIIVRSFNPRKPPYNFVYNKEAKVFIDIKDEESFPAMQ